MRHSSRNHRAGVTLVEVMLSLTVLTFGLAGVVQLVDSSEGQSQRSRKHVMAEMLAQEKAQELKSVGFDDLLVYLSDHEQDGERHMALYPLTPKEYSLGSRGGIRSNLNCLWQAELEQVDSAPRCIQIVSRTRWRELRAPNRQATERVYVFE